MIKTYSCELWGEPVRLEVRFDCFDDESPTDTQISALDNIVEHWDRVEDALPQLKDFCYEEDFHEFNEEGIDEPESIADIYRYLTPKQVYIQRNRENRVVGILCDYRFNPDGIAVIFKNELLDRIATQDWIL